MQAATRSLLLLAAAAAAFVAGIFPRSNWVGVPLYALAGVLLVLAIVAAVAARRRRDGRALATGVLVVSLLGLLLVVLTLVISIGIWASGGLD